MDGGTLLPTKQTTEYAQPAASAPLKHTSTMTGKTRTQSANTPKTPQGSTGRAGPTNWEDL
jgi:hypothetical protein